MGGGQVILWDPGWWPMPPHAQHDPGAGRGESPDAGQGLLKHELTHSLMFERRDGYRRVPDESFLVPGGNGGWGLPAKASGRSQESLSQWR